MSTTGSSGLRLRSRAASATIVSYLNDRTQHLRHHEPRPHDAHPGPEEENDAPS